MLDEDVERGAAVGRQLQNLRVDALHDVDQAGLLGDLGEAVLQIQRRGGVEPGAFVARDHVDLPREGLALVAGVVGEPAADVAGLADIGRAVVGQDVAGRHARRAPSTCP